MSDINQKPESIKSTQFGGDHYKAFVIEPVHFCHVNKAQIDPTAARAITYLCRYPHKGTAVLDLQKAVHFIAMILDWDYGIKMEYGFSNSPPKTPTLSGDDLSRQIADRVIETMQDLGIPLPPYMRDANAPLPPYVAAGGVVPESELIEKSAPGVLPNKAPTRSPITAWYVQEITIDNKVIGYECCRYDYETDKAIRLVSYSTQLHPSNPRYAEGLADCHDKATMRAQKENQKSRATSHAIQQRDQLREICEAYNGAD